MSTQTTNITPIYIDGLDCVDNTALTICNFLRGGYENVFWNSWSIKYKADYVIGRGLCETPDRIQKNIRKLYGIEFTPVGAFDRKQCRELVTRYMREDGLLVAGLKSNAFPWKEAYQQDVNGVHFLIFKEIGEEGIWCTDAMPKKENALLGWEDARRGLLSIIRIRECKKQEKVKPEKLLHHLKKNVRPQNIRSLQHKIATDFEIKREFGNQKNIWKIPLYNLFLTVKGGHEQFEIYLKNSELKNNELFLQMIHTLVGEWEALKVLTVKMHREYFAAKLSMEKTKNYKNIFVEKLGQIADLEEEALAQLKSTYKAKGSGECNSVLQENVIEEEANWYIDLTYNEYTHIVDSEDFYVGGTIQYGKIWTTQVSEFALPTVETNSYNCMYCDGQKLDLGKSVRKISLLLYATYGAQFEQIEVEYEDRKELVDLSVSDWTEEPLHHEEIAWRSDFKSKLPGNYDYTGKIAAVELQIDPQKVCRYIILPKCKEIHIFAVTIMGKK